MTPPTIVVSDEPVREAATRLRAALDAHGRRLAISGGSALRVLSDLFGPGEGARADVVLTWVDERVVRRASPESNAGQAERFFVMPRTCVPLLRDDELDDPNRAITRVEHAIDDAFHGALDVTLLGLGEDGHIASLFPRVADATGASGDTRSWNHGDARVMLVDDSPKPPSRRLTLTHSFLATAKVHVVFAVGAGKRHAIARLRDGDPSLPATGLEGLILITDAAGAAGDERPGTTGENE